MLAAGCLGRSSWRGLQQQQETASLHSVYVSVWGPGPGKSPRLQTWMAWLSSQDCLTAHSSFHRVCVSLSEELFFLLFGHLSDVTKNIRDINLLSLQLQCEFE